MGGTTSTRAIFIAMALTLGACATEQLSPAVTQSADYQSGYSDGCRTGNERSNGLSQRVFRNEAIFETNPNYQAGWRAGYGSCGGSPASPSQSIFNDDQWLRAF